MPRYDVYANVSGSVYLGSYEAEGEIEAIGLAEAKGHNEIRRLNRMEVEISIDDYEAEEEA
jgi:hypothetical protein